MRVARNTKGVFIVLLATINVCLCLLDGALPFKYYLLVSARYSWTDLYIIENDCYD